MKRATVGASVLASLLGIAACSGPTGPAASPGKAVPGSVSNTRYILASGETPPPGCNDLGNGWWECGDNSALQPAPLAKPTTFAQPNPAN